MKNVLGFFLKHVAADAALPTRMAKLLAFLLEAKPTMKEVATAHCEVAEMLARRLGFPESVQRTLRYYQEQWDGKGLAYGLKGDEVPVTSRIVHMAEVLTEVASSFGGPSAAVAVATERLGTVFEPEMVSTFLELSEKQDFWKILDQESVQQTVLEIKPPSRFDTVSESQVEGVCEVMADFTDISSPHTWNHSRTVADIAVGVAKEVGMGRDEVTKLRRAALVHDLGKVAIPSMVLQKQEGLTAPEWESFRLHPYYTERILSRVQSLSPLASEAAMHHERLDGQGYHRQLNGEQIPLTGRILAVADTYAGLQKRDGGTDLSEALDQMKGLVGTQLDATCVEALEASLNGTSSIKGRTRERVPRPGNITGREAEVLRQLAGGLSNKQIAKQLVISEKTVEAHLDHIYTKLGVSSRTAAVVFAVHNGIAT